MTAILKLSLTSILSVSRINKKPMRNEPVMLIRNVGRGNLSKTEDNGEMFTRYLATAPNDPPTATAKIFVTASIYQPNESAKLYCAAKFLSLNSNIMAESLYFTSGADRETVYGEIVPQIEALLSGETDLIANLANAAAVLREAFGFFWVGFYLEKGGELVLGPFQGPIACTRIAFGKGVCGHAYSTRETVIVPNVDEFPGHIACSSAAKSEIVLPIFNRDGSVLGVLDVDSERLADFTELDAKWLGQVVRAIESSL